MKKQMNKARENLVKEILNCLENDNLVWEQGWNFSYNDKLHNPVTKTIYKGINFLSLFISSMYNGYKDIRWCTYKQAEEKGWQVKKGSKGVPIEYYLMYDKIKKEYLSLHEYDKLIREEERLPMDFSLVSRHYVVFNAECIEGIPTLEKTEEINQNITMNDMCQNLIDNMEVGYDEFGDQPCYSPMFDKVIMPPRNNFKSQHLFDSTLLHELSHATGHISRLNRDMSGSFGSESYAVEELRAEFSSVFLSQYIDANLSQMHLDNHKAYIKSWITLIKKDPNVLFKAIKDAEEISDYMIDKGLGIEKDFSFNKNSDNKKFSSKKKNKDMSL